jgi:hypothetical protein
MHRIARDAMNGRKDKVAETPVIDWNIVLADALP